MSRIAKYPIKIPAGVEVSVNGNQVSIKGKKGSMTYEAHRLVTVSHEQGQLKFSASNDSVQGWTHAGTARSIIQNIVQGVNTGYEQKLEIVGVGYRAQVQGRKLNLALGFSHPVSFDIPEGITIEAPSQTEIVIKGVDYQRVGQVAAEIRAYRPPEPYKGKGVKYSNETIIRKEAKKA